MNILCPSCSADFEVDSSKMPADGLPLRCPSCSRVHHAHSESASFEPSLASFGASGGSGSQVERFFVKRPTGKVFGPFDKNAIRMMLEANKLSGDAQVSPDKENWMGLDEIPEFAEFATESESVGGMDNDYPGSTKLGGWANSVVEDDEEEAELPESRAPRLPKPKDDGPGLPKPKSDGPGLPKPKSRAPELPKSKSDAPGLPKPKRGGVDLPKTKGVEGLPQSKGADSLPQAKGPDSLPQAKGPDSLPQAKEEDDLFAAPVGSEDQNLFGSSDVADDDADDDLFAAPIDDEEEDLFGAPAESVEEESEEDLFAAPADDEEEDLFGAPDDEEEDLFGAPEEEEEELFGAPADEEDDLFGDAEAAEEDDLFDAPVDDEDPFGAPVGGGAPMGAEDSEDLFAAPEDDDDDDLFESGGLDDALFDDGDDGEEDDFLSGEASFSFLDDSPSGAQDDDLAGKSGEWGDDLMGNAPPSDDFGGDDFGSDDFGGDDFGGDDFGDDLAEDGAGELPDDDPFRPASRGPSQPASRGPSAQTTRDQAVEEDKKRGTMTMIGVPLVALLVLGGAGYALYTNFFADTETNEQVAKKQAGPITVDLQTAKSDNYGDLQAVIDQARKGELEAGEEPKLLLIESLFLSRYSDKDIAGHAKKLAGKYADSSEGWEALARGAYEAQNGSAEAARSYLEPLAGSGGEVGYYAQLMMGIGDVLALEKYLAENEQQDGATATQEGSEDQPAEDGASPDADGEQETAEAQGDDGEEGEEGENDEQGEEGENGEGADEDADQDDTANKNKKVAERTEHTERFDDSARRFASRASKALKGAAGAKADAATPHFWLGRLYGVGQEHDRAIDVLSKAIEASPEHVASRVALGESAYQRGNLNKASDSLETVLEEYEGLASTREQALAYHYIGRVHTARQNSEEAIKAYTKALSIDTERTDTLRALAEEYANAEKYQEALNFFTSNKNLGQEDPEVLLGIVRSHIGLEQWDEATQHLEEGEKQFPDNASFPLYLGKLNRKRGAFFDAQKALERAVEIEPKLLTAHAALAQLAWKVDEDGPKAEEHIATIREYPDEITADVAAEVAQFYQMSERPVIAERWYQAALERDPNFWDARLSLARMYLSTEQDEKALELLERARDEGVQDIRLSAYLADAYRQSGRYAKAVDQINAVIEKHPKNKEYIFIRGRIYFDQGNYDTAREDFNKAYEFDPRFHQAYFFVGRTAFEQGDYKKAMKIFRHVLDYKPNDGDFHYWMGRAYEAEDRLTQALEEYRNATKVDSDYGSSNPELYVRRGRLLSKLGYSVQGKRDIERALEINPSMFEALVAMGESNYRDKQYEEAIENFEKVLADNEKLPEIQYKLGMALMYTDKEIKGAKHLQQAVRHGYDDPDVFQTLGYLYKRMNKRQLAIKSFKEYLKRIADKDSVPIATKREMIHQIEELGGSL